MEDKTNDKKDSIKSEKKSNAFPYIISIVVIAVVVIGIVFFIQSSAKVNPEQTMKDYIQGIKEANVDKLMQVTDVKGAYAWGQAKEDVNKFQEEYNKVSKEIVEKYEKEAKEAFKEKISQYESLKEQLEMEVKNIEVEEIGKDLQKVKAVVTMKIVTKKKQKTENIQPNNQENVAQQEVTNQENKKEDDSALFSKDVKFVLTTYKGKCIASDEEV